MYTDFAAIGERFAHAVDRYVDIFQPLLSFYADLIRRFDTLCRRFRECQSTVAPKRWRTRKASMQAAGAHQSFESELAKFNQASNDSLFGLASICEGSAKQLLFDIDNSITPALAALSAAPLSAAAQEEAELDTYIAELRREIAADSAAAESAAQDSDSEFFSRYSTENLKSPLFEHLVNSATSDESSEEESNSLAAQCGPSDETDNDLDPHSFVCYW